MRPGETLSLTVTLPNEQRIVVPEAVVRWSRGQEFAVENVLIEQHNRVRLQHYVNRLVREPERMSQLVLTSPKRESKTLLKAVSRKHQGETDPLTGRRWREILNRGQNARKARVSGIGGKTRRVPQAARTSDVVRSTTLRSC